MGENVLRWALKEGLPSPLFAPAMKMGQLVRELLPASLKAKVPAPQNKGQWPTATHARKVLMLAGCVQPAMMPNINFATARVLDAAGIQTVLAQGEGCCGAVKYHLNDQTGGIANMRNNIDAWWPYIEPTDGQGVEAIVMNVSGCGAMVKDYGHILAGDPLYEAKAKRVSELTRDLSELLPALVPHLQPKLQHKVDKLAYHPPCTLQHGQKLKGGVEAGLTALGFEIQTACRDAHLCCGSAGTYSVMNPEIATTLRDRKLEVLAEVNASTIVSANIGCITHLQSGTTTPVRHWVEVLDEALR